jgi:FkbM family methyltransferase
MSDNNIKTIYGSFSAESKRRIDIVYDSERATLAAFLKCVKLFEARVFYDIGSNIGTYAIALHNSNPEVDTIHAFEPSPDTYLSLGYNVSLNNPLNKIITYPLALSNSQGAAKFFDYGDLAGDNSLIGKLKENPNRPPAIVDVSVDLFDNLFKGRNEVFSAKIDVEGAELKVLDGARNYLINNIGLIQVEYFQDDESALIACMQSLGYKLIFRVCEDFIFSNIDNIDFINKSRLIYYDEISESLNMLRQLNRDRRSGIRAYRHLMKLLDTNLNLSQKDVIDFYSKTINEIYKRIKYKTGDPIFNLTPDKTIVDFNLGSSV